MSDRVSTSTPDDSDEDIATIARGIRERCADFDDDYWYACDRDNGSRQSLSRRWLPEGGSDSRSPRTTAAAG